MQDSLQVRSLFPYQLQYRHNYLSLVAETHLMLHLAKDLFQVVFSNTQHRGESRQQDSSDYGGVVSLVQEH